MAVYDMNKPGGFMSGFGTSAAGGSPVDIATSLKSFGTGDRSEAFNNIDISTTNKGPGTGLGANIGTAKLALSGLQTLGNLWAAWQSNKLAKKQFAFTKDVTTANLTNQIKSYNTTLADRGRSRAHTESQTPEQAAAYVNKNRLAAFSRSG